MVRPSGGGAARNRKAALPSAEEQLGAFYGFGPQQTKGIQKIMGMSNPFQGLPTSASKGEFGEYSEIISIANDSSTMQFYKGQSASVNQAGEALARPNMQDWYLDDNGNWIDRSAYRQSYDVDEDTGELIVPGYQGPQMGESDAPAALTVVPTSTTNPDRPRTVAAGYDKSRQVLTVVFRDGTFYNYYEVSSSEWQAFKARVSKGRYIYQNLDYHPRGAADVSSISPTARKAFYKFSRMTQVASGGKKTKRPKIG